MIETEQLAWVVLRTVNRRHAKGSSARLVVPSDPEVASELGMDPDEDRLHTAVEFLLEWGYIVPADIDLRRGLRTNKGTLRTKNSRNSPSRRRYQDCPPLK